MQDEQLLTLLDENALQSLGFVHFYGERKPWAKNVDTSLFPAYVTVAKDLWLTYIKDLESTMEYIAFDHFTPLTGRGLAQYRRTQTSYGYVPSMVSTVPRTTVYQDILANSIFILSQNPSLSPVTITPTISTTETTPTLNTTIVIDSSVEWNASCSELNATALVEVAQVIEQSVYEGMSSNLKNGETINFVYVYSLCNQNVENHTGSVFARRLQSGNTSSISFLTTVTSGCENCASFVYTESKYALETIVDDETLSNTIGMKYVI